MRKKVFARLLRELGAKKAALIASIVFSSVSVVLSLRIPVVIGRAIDGMNRETDLSDIARILATIGVIALLSALFRWISDHLNNTITCKVTENIRKKAYYKLSRLPVSYFDNKPKGDVMNRIMSDTDAVGNGLLLGMSQFFSGIVTIVCTLAFMLGINLTITAAVVVLTPLSLVVASVIAKRTYKLFLEQSKCKANESAFLTETFKNLKLVKSFVREDASAEQYDKVADSYAAAARRAIFASSLTNPATRVVGATIYAAVGLIGALTVIGGGGLTVGGLTCFLSYAGQYSKPFNEISAVVSEIQGSIASASRIFELIDADEEEETGKESLGKVRGDVSFSHVSFSYDKGKALFQDVSFEVRAGQKVAIVGPTGCGKTTLINLMMRFYEPDSGKILIDGEDIGRFTRSSLRENFGMVLQDTFLFDATVRENISVGEKASGEECEAAAKLSHADTFIKKLPEAYGTRLFEGGDELSEGERQLLSITRVMLSRPRILILDEATSSVDTRTEAKINDAFEKLMEGRTSFIVAHRISTVKNADLILVMKDGDIVEAGRHDELMAKGGFYKSLYESQFGA